MNEDLEGNEDNAAGDAGDAAVITQRMHLNELQLVNIICVLPSIIGITSDINIDNELDRIFLLFNNQTGISQTGISQINFKKQIKEWRIQFKNNLKSVHDLGGLDHYIHLPASIMLDMKRGHDHDQVITTSQFKKRYPKKYVLFTTSDRECAINASRYSIPTLFFTTTGKKKLNIKPAVDIFQSYVHRGGHTDTSDSQCDIDCTSEITLLEIMHIISMKAYYFIKTISHIKSLNSLENSPERVNVYMMSVYLKVYDEIKQYIINTYKGGIYYIKNEMELIKLFRIMTVTNNNDLKYKLIFLLAKYYDTVDIFPNFELFGLKQYIPITDGNVIHPSIPGFNEDVSNVSLRSRSRPRSRPPARSRPRAPSRSRSRPRAPSRSRSRYGSRTRTVPAPSVPSPSVPAPSVPAPSVPVPTPASRPRPRAPISLQKYFKIIQNQKKNNLPYQIGSPLASNSNTNGGTRKKHHKIHKIHKKHKTQKHNRNNRNKRQTRKH